VRRPGIDTPREQCRRGVAAVVVALHLAVAATSVHGQMLDVLRYAPDITVDLGGTVVGAGVLASDDLSGGVTILAIPNLPAEARITAAHRFANGDLLLAFDSTLTLPGLGGIAEPRDIVRFTSATNTYSVEVHGADVGIPTDAAVDALAVTGDGTILLSLDISVAGFEDEDVIKINGTDLELFLDLSAVGIDKALDLDGLDIKENGATVLYVSLDGSGTVDSVAFDDEDVLAYNLTTQTWSLVYDGSAADAHWPDAADLTALDVALVASPTATPTLTPIATDTATATSIATQVASATATLTAVTPVTGTATSTATGPLSTPTATATATLSATAPPSVGATATATATASGTHTATASATATAGISCSGDCDGSGEVTINELITLVNIALGSLPVSACPAGDVNADGMIAINEIVAAVANALNGCPG
jgi:hypothetical protein